jgi:hypothetical protein
MQRQPGGMAALYFGEHRLVVRVPPGPQKDLRRVETRRLQRGRPGAEVGSSALMERIIAVFPLFHSGIGKRQPGRDAAKPWKGEQKREQRIIVFGNGNFLANAYIANAGNLDLGMSLINWLSQDDAYVSIPIKTARDRTLNLSRNAQITIAAGFLAVLPLLMIGSGVFIWLRRRRR